MRLLSLITFALSASLFSAEPYPLWEGKESVADYAKRVNLPPTQSLDLGNGVKLDMVLIPAGTFFMGTPEPQPVDEAAFQNKIVTGQALLVVSAVALLVMLTVALIRAIRQKRRPQLSLGLLLTTPPPLPTPAQTHRHTLPAQMHRPRSNLRNRQPPADRGEAGTCN